VALSVLCALCVRLLPWPRICLFGNPLGMGSVDPEGNSLRVVMAAQAVAGCYARLKPSVFRVRPISLWP